MAQGGGAEGGTRWGEEPCLTRPDALAPAHVIPRWTALPPRCTDWCKKQDYGNKTEKRQKQKVLVLKITREEKNGPHKAGSPKCERLEPESLMGPAHRPRSFPSSKSHTRKKTTQKLQNLRKKTFLLLGFQDSRGSWLLFPKSDHTVTIHPKEQLHSLNHIKITSEVI